MQRRANNLANQVQVVVRLSIEVFRTTHRAERRQTSEFAPPTLCELVRGDHERPAQESCFPQVVACFTL